MFQYQIIENSRTKARQASNNIEYLLYLNT